jgi:hypothetical protein
VRLVRLWHSSTRCGVPYCAPYCNHADNASKYDKDEVKTIKNRIKRAAEDKGVEIEAS